MKKNRFEPQPKESTIWLLVLAMIILLIAFTWAKRNISYANPGLNKSEYFATKKHVT